MTNTTTTAARMVAALILCLTMGCADERWHDARRRECQHIMSLARTAADTALLGRYIPSGTGQSCELWVASPIAPDTQLGEVGRGQ